MDTSSSKKVAVIDPDVDMCEVFVDLFEAVGHEAVPINNLNKLCEQLALFQPDAVVLSLSSEPAQWEALVSSIRACVPNKPIKLLGLTAWIIGVYDEAVKQAGFDYLLRKPAGLDEICAVLDLPLSRSKTGSLVKTES